MGINTYFRIMKRDLIILFLIIFGVDLLLGDVRYLIGAADKQAAFDQVFSLNNLWLSITFMIGIGSMVLFTFYILSKYYPIKEHARYVIFLIIGLVFSVFIRYALQELAGRYFFGAGNYKKGVSLWYYMIDNFYYSFLYFAIAITYFFVRHAFKNEKEKMELLVENKATQLQLLKSQINPHFLFNNLNNIYSLVYQKSENALPTIDKLSNLLRYSLYEVGQKVTIDQEMNQIDNFIELQKLRLDKKLELVIKPGKVTQNIEIPPLLFFPFIENAFKHGELHNEKNPIRIELDQDGKYIYFTSSNKVASIEKDEVGGIGLENIRKRLNLIYGNKHSFSIVEKDDLFQVSLKIPVKYD